MVDSILNFIVREFIPGYQSLSQDDLVSLAERNDTETIWERTHKIFKTADMIWNLLQKVE